MLLSHSRSLPLAHSLLLEPSPVAAANQRSPGGGSMGAGAVDSPCPRVSRRRSALWVVVGARGQPVYVGKITAALKWAPSCHINSGPRIPPLPIVLSDRVRRPRRFISSARFSWHDSLADLLQRSTAWGGKKENLTHSILRTKNGAAILRFDRGIS